MQNNSRFNDFTPGQVVTVCRPGRSTYKAKIVFLHHWYWRGVKQLELIIRREGQSSVENMHPTWCFTRKHREMLKESGPDDSRYY